METNPLNEFLLNWYALTKSSVPLGLMHILFVKQNANTEQWLLGSLILSLFLFPSIQHGAKGTKTYAPFCGRTGSRHNAKVSMHYKQAADPMYIWTLSLVIQL